MNNFKIATFIISSSTYPAVRNVKAQKKIYLDSQSQLENIFWYRQGDKDQLCGKTANLIENDLFLDISDDTLSMGKKTLLALEWAEENIDYDFIVRPTPSSYVNFNNLEQFIDNNLISEDIVYAGSIQETKDNDGNTITFVSGSTLVLNQKCVQLILENKHLWDHSYWDDVGLALLLEKLGVEAVHVDRFDVPGNPYLDKIPMKYYQYRCRADNHYGYPRLIESHVLKYINKLSLNKKVTHLEKYFYLAIIEISRFIYIYQFGWKVYMTIRKLLYKLLPTFAYRKIKQLLSRNITNFKLKRFKT